MSYKPNDLSVLSYANGFTLWHYVTDDPRADVEAEGYFDKAAAMLRPSDVIMTSLRAAKAVAFYLVGPVAAGVVSLSNGLNGGATTP